MDNNKVNIINGAVVGVQLGTPMQDATPAKPEDNEAYATERNTETRMANFNTEENLEKQPEPTGGGLTELPEGYPYKTGMTIEWDGNTEGRYSLNETTIHVSDVIISNENLKNSTFVMSDGVSFSNKDFWEKLEQAGVISEDYAMVSGGMVVRKNNCEITMQGTTITVEKAGVYFMRQSETEYVASLTFGEVHPMAEEFMPLLTSPNGTKYKLTVADDGTLSAVAVS